MGFRLQVLCLGTLRPPDPRLETDRARENPAPSAFPLTWPLPLTWPVDLAVALAVAVVHWRSR